MCGDKRTLKAEDRTSNAAPMNTHHCSQTRVIASRRDFLQSTGTGFGWLALNAMQAQLASAASPLDPKKPHIAPKAKRVIFFFMDGGPSHLDTFDYKPKMKISAQATPSVFDFKPGGKSGLMMSSIFPKLAEHADHMCVLNGMHTVTASHTEAQLALHTGTDRGVRPSLGSWTLYGLGSETQDLPGFITIDPVGGVGVRGYGNAYLSSIYQGTRLTSGKGLAFIEPKQAEAEQLRQIDLMRRLGHQLQLEDPANTEIEGVISSFERAFAMQTSVPEVLDITKEDAATIKLYGESKLGQQCLLARRLAEKGVRFIQIGVGGWDNHSNIKGALEGKGAQIDGPIAALMTDLKQRSLLEDTLIVWGGEFGRTPRSRNGGRDHNNKGFSMWLAGGGVKGGHRHGATNDVGAEAVEGRVSILDLHATILHLLGLKMEKLTYPFADRDVRLRGDLGSVVQEILT